MAENIEELLNNKYGIVGKWDSKNKENDYLLFDSVSKIAQTNTPKEYLEDILKNQSDFCINVFAKYSNTSFGGVELVDLKNLLKIVQLIPSPNAEPIKMYMAKCGEQMIDEIFDSELIFERLIKS